MKTVTINQVMGWGPCEGWPRGRIEAEVFKGRTEISVLDLLDLVNEIPAADILWAVLHNEFFDSSDLHMMAAAFAEQRLSSATDVRSRNAVRVSRLYAMDEASDDELSAAWDAAWDADWGMVNGSCWGAVNGSVWETAWYVAWETAWRVACGASLGLFNVLVNGSLKEATWEDAWGATREAAHKKQLEIVRLYATAQTETIQ